MKIQYWCNTNMDKFFGGYKASDTLVFVGEEDCKNIEESFDLFNRGSGRTSLLLDRAKAPSMSVGDVIYLPETDTWKSCASLGWKDIDQPLREHRVTGRFVNEVVDEMNHR